MTTTTPIASGGIITVFFYLDPDKPGARLSSGTTINLKLHSAGGMDFPKLVELA